MFFRSLMIVMVGVFLLSCASKWKTLKEIDKEPPHSGHLYKMNDTIVEVVELPESRLKFYFYSFYENGDLKPITADNITLKNGIIDPKETKEDFSIDFIHRNNFIEGIVTHYKVSERTNFDVRVDVKIGDKRRLINIPWRGVKD